MNTEPLNLINGKIITLNGSFPIIDSLTIKNGQFYRFNNPHPNFKTIDLQGAFVIPGFIDAHFHIKNLGQRLDMINLKGVKSAHEIVSLVYKKSKTLKAGEWIEGFGWDQNLWKDKNFPKSELLNKVIKNNPVYLTRIDGHSAWINNIAAKISNFDLSTNIDGGSIINKCILIDNAMDPIRGTLPKENKESTKKWLLSGAQYAAERGITNVHDAWQSPEIIESIIELVQEHNFPIKCYY